MFDFKLARAFHHIERADQIRIDVCSRVLQTVANPRLRGEMHDYVGSLAPSQFGQRFMIFEHADLFHEVLVLQQHLMATLLEPDIVIVGHPVIPYDGKPVCQQAPRQVKADEAGRSGNQDLSHYGVALINACLVGWPQRIPSTERYIGSVFLFHADQVVASVNVVGFAGDAG